MHGVGNAQTLGASRRVHVLGAVGPDEGRVVQVAPIVDVVGEEVGGDAELLHPKELALTHVLIMLDPVAGLELRILPLGFAESGERNLSGLIAVGVDHRLKSALADLANPLVEVGLRDVGDAVGARHAPTRR